MEIESGPLKPECLYLGATRAYNLKKKNPDEYDLRLRHKLFFSAEEACEAKEVELDSAAQEVGFKSKRDYRKMLNDDTTTLYLENRVAHAYGGCLSYLVTHLWSGRNIKAPKQPTREKPTEAKPMLLGASSSEDIDIHSNEEEGSEDSNGDDDEESGESSEGERSDEIVKVDKNEQIVFRTKAQAQAVRDAMRAFELCNLKFGLPKEVVAIISQYVYKFWHKCRMSHIQASPIVSGSRVYLVTTRMFIATYDCVDVESHMLCLGNLNDAMELCKILFFEEVDRVWRGGFQSNFDWESVGLVAPKSKKKTERLKWKSLSDVDDWRVRDFRAKWEGDDSLGKHAIDGPAIATVTEFVLTRNRGGVFPEWKCSEGQVVFQLPVPDRSAKRVKTNS